MEQKVKKRDWVKNAAIIFLAVMLVLTFFSNTILNRTLPEVVTRYVEPGSIDAKVRISGTVSARENYDVIIDQTRKVAAVNVKVGQEVSTGDLLFSLEASESEELEEARKELERLQREYQRSLLTGTDADYSRENRDIALARAALEKAQAKLDGIVFIGEDALNAAAAKVTQAEDALESAKAAVKKAAQELKDAQYGFEHSSTGSGYSGGSTGALQNQVVAAQAALTDATNALRAAHLNYDANFNAFMLDALNDILAAKGVTMNDDDKAFVIGAVEERLKPVKTLPGLVLDSVAKAGDGSPVTGADAAVQTFLGLMPYYMSLKAAEYADVAAADPAYPVVSAKLAAYNKVTEAADAYDAAAAALENAQSALADANSSATYDGDVYYNNKPHSYWEKEVTRLQPILENAQERQTEAEEALTKAKAEEEKLKSDKAAREADYAAAQAEAETAQRSLEDLLFSLTQQQKADGKSQALEAIAREELQANIADQEKKIEELSGSTVTEVRAKVNGTIASISVSAGHKAEAEKPLATIEVKDLGYTMTATINTDQARLLHVGDTANISNYYWGSRTTAVLSSMQPDPKDPRTSRVLSFDIAGDVNAGDQISFSIGEKNASYDLVVPNSAVRSDTNGSFVLMITAKNSPLGNRYFATRVDVEVVASDDYNTAVKGALSNMDSVITTSSGNAPIKNGDQVRLADMN